MLNKLFVLAPIAIVSIAMSGCSGTKTVSNKNLNTKAGAVKSETSMINNESDDVPVVYEKRSPPKQQAKHSKKL